MYRDDGWLDGRLTPFPMGEARNVRVREVRDFRKSALISLNDVTVRRLRRPLLRSESIQKTVQRYERSHAHHFRVHSCDGVQWGVDERKV